MNNRRAYFHKITAAALLKSLQPKKRGRAPRMINGEPGPRLAAILAEAERETVKRPPVVSAPRQPIGKLKPETRVEIERIMSARGKLAR